MVNSDCASLILSPIKGQKLLIVLPSRKIDITKGVGIRLLLWTHSDLSEVDSSRPDETLDIVEGRLIRELANEANETTSFVALALRATLFGEIETKSVWIDRGYQACQPWALLFLNCLVVFLRKRVFCQWQWWQIRNAEIIIRVDITPVTVIEHVRRRGQESGLSYERLKAAAESFNMFETSWSNKNVRKKNNNRKTR